MDNQKELNISTDHAISVIQKMLSSHNSDTDLNSLTDSDLKELVNFLRCETGLDYYSFPTFLGNLFIHDERLTKVWESLAKLKIVDRKLLFFTAAGYDPALIVESLGFTGIKNYWDGLERLKKQILHDSGSEFNSAATLKIARILTDILHQFLDISDEIEKQEIKKTKKSRILYMSGFVLLLMAVSYVFLWNIVIPPQGEKIYSERIGIITEDFGQDLDSLDWFTNVREAMADGEFIEAVQYIEEEFIISAEWPLEVKSLYILLLLKEERYDEAKDVLRELKFDSDLVYNSYFKGITWKIRFLTE